MTYIHPDAKFYDLDVSAGRPGRNRLHYFYEAKMEQIYKYFEELVVTKDTKLLQLPHVLTSSAAAASLPFAGVE